MNDQTLPSKRAVAVSVSENPDMPVLGLSNGHLRSAMFEIFQYMLYKKVHIVYGGDLRQNGFTELLSEMLVRYRPVGEAFYGYLGVTNYLAWPVHIRMPIGEIEEFDEMLTESGRLVCLDKTGNPMTLEERRPMREIEPTDDDWNCGLTAMRQRMLKETDVRIILGGRVDGYKGVMPGIGEEALISLKARQPLFIVGGFGGCAGDIAVSIGLKEDNLFEYRAWQGREAFENFSADDLNNGLTFEENSVLASTPYIDQTIVMILRGLIRMDYISKVLSRN